MKGDKDDRPATEEGRQPTSNGEHPDQRDLNKGGALAAGDTEVQVLPATWVDRLLGGAAIALLSTICVVLLLQVVMRYFFASPLAWSEELARYLFVWLTFLGAALAFRLRAHIAVDVVTELLNRRGSVLPARVLNGAIQGIVLIFLIAILLGGINLVQQTSGQVTPGLRIPMAWVYLAIPVGSLIMILSAISQAVSVWYKNRSSTGEADR